jgi:hypothetical protein
MGFQDEVTSICRIDEANNRMAVVENLHPVVLAYSLVR